MKATILIRLKDGVIDPKGNAVKNALLAMGFQGVKDVRIGKIVEIIFEEGTLSQNTCKEMCLFLANPIIEEFEIRFEDSDKKI